MYQFRYLMNNLMSNKCENSCLSFASLFTELNIEGMRDGRETDTIEVTRQHIDN